MTDVEAEISGGSHDGERFTLPHTLDVKLISARAIETYRFTGSIKDDGTRIFALHHVEQDWFDTL